MPKLVILASLGPHAMAETTIDFATQAELDAYLVKREAEKKAKRDWAVRVLDAWAESNGGWWQVDTFLTPGLKGWTCEYSAPRDKRGVRSGPTPDAARLAAAEAVYPTLPADVRAKLGARP